MTCSKSSLMGIGCVTMFTDAIFLSLHIDDLFARPDLLCILS